MDDKQSKVYERLNVSLLCNLCVKYAVVITAVRISPKRRRRPFPSPPLTCPTFLPSALIISGIIYSGISAISNLLKGHIVSSAYTIYLRPYGSAFSKTAPPLYNGISHVPPLHIQWSHTASTQYTSPVLSLFPVSPIFGIFQFWRKLQAYPQDPVDAVRFA